MKLQPIAVLQSILFAILVLAFSLCDAMPISNSTLEPFNDTSSKSPPVVSVSTGHNNANDARTDICFFTMWSVSARKNYEKPSRFILRNWDGKTGASFQARDVHYRKGTWHSVTHNQYLNTNLWESEFKDNFFCWDTEQTAMEKAMSSRDWEGVASALFIPRTRLVLAARLK
ncbi:hypothetical protein J3R30DRAFT_2896436 [Lentinula aciculospora]|uniref:Uncharacterized protein n=1 Tax=Lentinula aciculospora TaxID=153920 RepID=A0A9W9ABX8_9AGAR|nr:hypothetical protein J3R30DRAFT_2896436 [Lentinula aciculospora]